MDNYYCYKYVPCVTIRIRRTPFHSIMSIHSFTNLYDKLCDIYIYTAKLFAKITIDFL